MSIGQGGATTVVIAALCVLVGAGLVGMSATGTRRVATTEAPELSLDGLTGLPNRRGFFAMATGMVADTEAEDAAPVWLARIDLDRFKAVNDAYGTSMGDAMLAQTGTILAASGSYVGRFEGDEFLMVLRGLSAHEVDVTLADAMERLRVAQIDGEQIELGCTVVVVQAGPRRSGEPPIGIEQLVAETELGMYRAKRLGRGRLVHVDVATQEALARFRDGSAAQILDVGVRLQRSLADRSIVGARIVPQVPAAGPTGEPLEGPDLQLIAEFTGRRSACWTRPWPRYSSSGRPIPPAGLRLWFEVSAVDLVVPTAASGLWARGCPTSGCRARRSASS